MRLLHLRSHAFVVLMGTDDMQYLFVIVFATHFQLHKRFQGYNSQVYSDP